MEFNGSPRSLPQRSFMKVVLAPDLMSVPTEPWPSSYPFKQQNTNASMCSVYYQDSPQPLQLKERAQKQTMTCLREGAGVKKTGAQTQLCVRREGLLDMLLLNRDPS